MPPDVKFNKIRMPKKMSKEMPNEMPPSSPQRVRVALLLPGDSDTDQLLKLLWNAIENIRSWRWTWRLG